MIFQENDIKGGMRTSGVTNVCVPSFHCVLVRTDEVVCVSTTCLRVKGSV